jgi:hypothetical protein
MIKHIVSVAGGPDGASWQSIFTGVVAAVKGRVVTLVFV